MKKNMKRKEKVIKKTNKNEVDKNHQKKKLIEFHLRILVFNKCLGGICRAEAFLQILEW